jgi:hypothetical protein
MNRRERSRRESFGGVLVDDRVVFVVHVSENDVRYVTTRYGNMQF